MKINKLYFILNKNNFPSITKNEQHKKCRIRDFFYAEKRQQEYRNSVGDLKSLKMHNPTLHSNDPLSDSVTNISDTNYSFQSG